MKLVILGKNKDDKGTQLEQLAIKILKSQGYVKIIPNMQVSGASELDVTAQKSDQTGIKEINTPVICECKAHESPINMTDWLKFIGKLAIERKKNPNAIGLMIALSGANGSVMGSYQTDFFNDSTVQLIANDDIIKLLSNFNILSNEKEVETIVNNLNIGRIAEISLVYYEHQIWWLVGFIDGKFTFLNSSTKFVSESEISEVLSILPNYTTYQYTNFVDVIHTIEFVQQAKQIEILILNNVLSNKGNVGLVDIAKCIKNTITNETINEDWLIEIIDKSAFLQVNEGQICLCDIKDMDIPSFYRFVISNETPIDLFSSEFYQRHIDDIKGFTEIYRINSSRFSCNNRKATDEMNIERDIANFKKQQQEAEKGTVNQLEEVKETPNVAKKVERVKISKIVNKRLLLSENDVDEYIKSLELQLKKMIKEDKEIQIID